MHKRLIGVYLGIKLCLLENRKGENPKQKLINHKFTMFCNLYS